MPMRSLAALLFVSAVIPILAPHQATAFDLIKDGKAQAILVIPDRPPAHLRAAVNDFVATLKESTSVELPVLTESSTPGRKEPNKLYIGDTEHAAKLNLGSNGLEEEAYRIKIGENEGFIVAHDLIRSENPNRFEANSLATKWALNALLERHVGVRWLWPGALGTYVPRHAEISIETMDKTAQPVFIQRRQRIPKMIDGPGIKKLGRLQSPEQRTKIVREAIDWLENHQGGYRGNLLVKGHPFGNWWKKYSRDHPDYFAELPPPLTQPYQGSPGKVKLRLSNPAVIDRIAREYTEAGAPDVWKVSPNDAGGFDTSEATRTWDIPKNQSLDAIVYSEANLTARYVKFWNLIYERLSAINPDLILNSLAYASYRYPPPKERPLKARMILSMVPSYTEFDTWKAWADTGSQLILRPNWWCGGGGAPWLPITQVSEFFKFCASHGLVGFDFDSIMGYWSTQGFNYYLIARLGANPALTREEIVDEYASAFGKAAPRIEDYLRYWDDFSRKAGYSVHVGNQVGPDAGGLFEKIVQEQKISSNPWVGSLQVMPYLYTDDVISRAETILDGADALLSKEESSETGPARARVAFLRTGLTHLKLLRDTMEAGMAVNASPTPNDDLKEEFAARAGDLYQLRKQLAGQHVVWVEWAYLFEHSARQPTLMDNLNLTEPDWRGE